MTSSSFFFSQEHDSEFTDFDMEPVWFVYLGANAVLGMTNCFNNLIAFVFSSQLSWVSYSQRILLPLNRMSMTPLWRSLKQEKST